MVRTLSLLVGVGVVSAAVAADPAPWPQFRGPAGAGVAPDGQKPPTDIGPAKNLKWKVAVPSGYSSPVVVGDKLILTGFENNKLLTIAYSRADGKELWRREAPAKAIEAYHKTESSPAASTPATDGERVVVYFGSCGLICYDLAGEQVWRYELPVAQTNNDFGTGSSPVLADGLVLLLRDTKADSSLLAVDAKTGSLAWEAKRPGFKTSWGSVCVWDTPAGKQAVAAGTRTVKGYDLKTGAEKWSLTGIPAVPCTTPLVTDGRLVFAGWAPGGSDFKMPTFDEVLKMAGEENLGHLTKAGSQKTFLKEFFDNNDENKDGKITREEWDDLNKALNSGKNIAFALKPGVAGEVTPDKFEWTVTKNLPYVPSPLVYRGLMYTVNMQGLLSAFDVKTGKPVYEAERVGLTQVYASPVAANGYIYLCGLDKTVLVLKAGDDPEKVCTAKLDERIPATPAIADNVLYIRSTKSLYAFEAK